MLVQRSITSFGLSQVILTFEDDVDIYWARQQVAERLPDAEVPPGVEPHLGPNDTPVGQVYQYTLESDHHSPSELRSWQDWVVSKHLMRAPGVADVVSFGGFQKEYHVLADPARLRANGLTLKDLIDAVGGVERRHLGRLPASTARASSWCAGAATCTAPRDIENTVIKRDRTARRCWCATWPRWSSRTRRAAGRWRAARPSTRSRGRSSFAAARTPRTCSTGVHEAVERINRDVLPTGMKIVPFYDRTRLVDTTLHTVSHNMLEGVGAGQLRALAVPARLLRLAWRWPSPCRWRCWRRSSASTTPGVPGQPALDGGDRLRHPARRRGHPGRERLPPPGRGAAAARERCPHVVARAAKEVVRPTLFSMAIIGAAMMPIFTLERVEGRIFRPVALTYAFALGGALLFTLTAVPALTAVLLKHRKVQEDEPALPASGCARATCARCAWPCASRWRRRSSALVVLAVALSLDPAPRRGVPARDERGRHPRHRDHAQRGLARARRRDPARDAPRRC